MLTIFERVVGVYTYYVTCCKLIHDEFYQHATLMKREIHCALLLYFF